MSEELVAAIEARLAGRTDRHDEAFIVEALRSAPAGELDGAILRLDLRRLLADVDNRLFGPDHYRALLAALSEERVEALSIEARARLIAALQTGRTSRDDERAIAAILCATHGRALTALKNALDHGSDHRDLQQLVFSDIDDASLRQTIVEHFAAAAEPSGEVKVLSDIDDTFYANWKDQRFPAKTVYPGVLQLYAELDRGPAEDGRRGDLAFVTARPKDRPGWVEGLTHQSLRERGVEAATVLCGSLRNLLTSRSIADKKLANFIDYAALFPEYGFVFVGDSGQGDAIFGKRMRAHAPERVRAVLIHDVVDTPEPERRAWRDEGVCFFDTYVGAGIEALSLGLIAPGGLERIIAAARAELADINFDSPAQEAAALERMTRDSQRAAELLSGAP